MILTILVFVLVVVFWNDRVIKKLTFNDIIPFKIKNDWHLAFLGEVVNGVINYKVEDRLINRIIKDGYDVMDYFHIAIELTLNIIIRKTNLKQVMFDV